MYNTRLDVAPFLNRVNSGSGATVGALATAFDGIANMLDAHGETSDAKLLSGLKEEQNLSKIDEKAFYNPLNAFKAKKVVEDNQTKQRENEQIARDDAKYAVNEYTKDAINDLWTMDKKSFDDKYKNAGGLDYTQIQKARNDKTQQQRNNTLYNQSQEEYKYKIDERVKTDAGKKLLNDVNSGTITTLDGLALYADSVDAPSFNQAKTILESNIEKNKINDISSKYKSWDEFKKSEDWANSSYKIKDTLSKSKAWGTNGDKELTFDQKIKKQQIDLRTKDLPTQMKKYQEKTGKPMSLTEQTAFVYEGKLPDTIKDDELKDLPNNVYDGLSGILEYKNATKEIKDNYSADKVGWFDSAMNSVSNFFTEGDYSENALHSAHANLKNIIIKLRSGSAVSAQEAQRMLDELGSISSSESKLKAGLSNFVNSLSEKVKAQKGIYEKGGYKTEVFDEVIAVVDTMKNDVNSLISNEIRKKNKKNMQSITKRKNEGITKQKTFTPDDLRNLGQ